MALRTFRSNPALGGFGGESTDLLLNDERLGSVSIRGSDGDAINQIIKELVDNSVDACGHSVNSADNIPKRVRVEIQQFRAARQRPVDDESTHKNDYGEVLRITVADNGCGMSDIQSCVNAFHTSKAHATQETPEEEGTAGTNNESTEAETAGRYGIGLTLCLLHAQRLVPGSCALIRSATSEKPDWSTMKCLVDTEGDSIECTPCAPVAKSCENESGTSVSLLVPGGTGASLAWPRIAEYFARFKLSLGMKCSLEVLAPMLSRTPLFIRPLSQTKPQEQVEENDDDDQDEHSWVDGLADGFDRTEATNSEPRVPAGKSSTGRDDERTQIWKASQLYLGRSFDESNVAHAVVPIRINARSDDSSGKRQPKLEVFLIVHGPGDEEEEDIGELAAASDPESEANDHEEHSSRTASMVLVRMVNRIPLLDSSEAVACGLVQSIASKKQVWNSFGLDVSQNSTSSVAKLLCFDVKDSEQVAPFFRRGNHALLEEQEDDEEEYESDTLEEEDVPLGVKRRRRGPRHVLPASVRLGNILLVVQFHAQPSTLPLPTLSKGRLPVDNPAIENAMEVALSQCLQQLQKTNPDLLLTASELKSAERDARYVPATSSAISSILCRSRNNSVEAAMQKIRSWRISEDGTDEESESGSIRGINEQLQMVSLGRLLEARFRAVVANEGKKRKQESEQQDDESQYDTEDALVADTYVSNLANELPREVSPTFRSPSPSREEDSTEAPLDDDATEFDGFEDW